MKKLIIALTLFTILSFINSILAVDKKNFLKDYIKKNNLNATVIVENIKTGKKIIYNKKRAKQSFLPASTFKIVNTLIALEERVIQDENEIIKWDGIDKGYAPWNQDQTLVTAFPISCVWFYQELAKRIGNNNYLTYLKKLNYGNRKTGKELTTFWLDGELRISALEQINIIRNIYLEKYNFNSNHYQILKKIMIVDKTEEYLMRAKTGWAMRVEHQIGWYVGYLETQHGTWLFACNLDIRYNGDQNFRAKLIYKAFQELGIIKS